MLNAIAETIKAQADSCTLLRKQVIQMAEDFDLDGIQKLADDSDGCSLSKYLITLPDTLKEGNDETQPPTITNRSVTDVVGVLQLRHGSGAQAAAQRF